MTLPIILERMIKRYHPDDTQKLLAVIPHLQEFLKWYRPYRAKANHYWFERYEITMFPPTQNQINRLVLSFSHLQLQVLYHCFFRHQNRDYLRQLPEHLKVIGRMAGPRRFRWLLEDFRLWCYNKCVNYKKMY